MTARWLAARARISLGVCVVLIVLAPLAARATEQCAHIADPTARLACYDAAHPAQGPAATNPPPTPVSSAATPVHAPIVPWTGIDPAVPQASTAASAPPAVRQLEPVAAAERAPNVVASAPASPAAPVLPESPTGQGTTDRFGRLPEHPLAAADDLDQLASTVVAIRKQARQNTAYRLANGQVWMQTTPREVTIDEGDQVTIRRGLLGGYVLRNRDGASTRVGRIH